MLQAYLVEMVSDRGSVERGQYVASMSALRSSATRFSKILVMNFLNSARIRGSDPTEQYRLGKLVLESIKFRRSLLEARRGPKWSEENELRRMERQVWKIMFKLEKKNPVKGRLELARFSTDLIRIMSDYRRTKRNRALD